VLGELGDASTSPELLLRAVRDHDMTFLVDDGHADVQRIEYLLKMALGSQCVREPRDRGDHADRSAALVVGDVRAMLHDSVGAVRPPEPVLVGPSRCSFTDRGIDTRDDALTVGGVDPLVPPGDVASEQGRVVVEQGCCGLIPGDAVGGEVPVPDYLLRCLSQHPMPLLIDAQRDVGLLPLGDVLDACDEVARLSFGARHHRHVHERPYDCAGRAHVPHLHGIGPALSSL
jgi:hypothetical protein